jgi:GrpB-like predicted nucleotidyltransferase (UPF0157 family)
LRSRRNEVEGCGSHARTAREYYELKVKLAAQHGADRDGYTDAKTAFIKSVEAKTRTAMIG